MCENNEVTNFGIGESSISSHSYSLYKLSKKIEDTKIRIEHKENNKVLGYVEFKLDLVKNDDITIVESMYITKKKAHKKYKDELVCELNKVLNEILEDIYKDDLKEGVFNCGIREIKDGSYVNKCIIKTGELDKFAKVDGKVLYIKDNILFEKVSLYDWGHKYDGFEYIKNKLKEDYYKFGEEEYPEIYYINDGYYFESVGRLL